MRRQLLLVAVVLTSLIAGAAPAAGQETATLTVSVVSESGDPVGGATIDATWDGGETSATTAGNGKAFVDVPNGADVKLDVESDDYIRNTPRLITDASQQDVEVTVAPKGTLTVETADPDGAVANARVDLIRSGEIIAEGRTNESGALVFPVIEQGEYVLRTVKSGYYRNASRITVDAESNESVDMRRGRVNVEFQAVDGHFSPPETLNDAKIAIDQIGTQRTAGGAVTFTVPVNTRYQVTASKDGYASNETSIYVGTKSDLKTLLIERERNLTVEASNERVVVGERVQVRVTNAYDEPVGGAALLVDGEQVAQTGDDGTARVPIESEDDHAITAQFEGVESSAVTVEGVAVHDSSTQTATAERTTTPESGLSVPMSGFSLMTVVLALLAFAGVALFSRFR